ncbi:MAG: VOC family protein [Candidatus Eremiobacteraeota bacterium]|nr:VOC family protein [Candidatus Eremiobacteraeota bacterium]MBV8354834.1 VOC family protein [Candidatus Eremiobacteraeota bacterium]
MTNERKVVFAGFDHIDSRVRDLAAARRFYDLLMPELGLTETVEIENGIEYYEPYRPGQARRFFGLNEDREHRANATRISFAADTPADVDRLALVIARAGAKTIEGPEIPYSSEKYYAVFFEDPSGNRLEIAYRRSHDDAVAIRLERDDARAVIEAKDAFRAV